MKTIVLLPFLVFGLTSAAHFLEPNMASFDESRIVGGSEADFTAVPYQASIRTIGHVCSAAILNDYWLLTAANCLVGLSEPLTTIRYGTASITSPPSTGEEVKVRQFIIHPGYNRTIIHNDIALIKTRTAMDITVYKRPARLPPQDEDSPVGKRGRAYGWGYTSSTSLALSPTLQSVPLTVYLTYERCHKPFQDLEIVLECSKTVCAGDDLGGAGLCGRGDGGSLFVESERVVGVGSFSIACGHARYPSVFTQVSRYVDWINGFILA